MQAHVINNECRLGQILPNNDRTLRGIHAGKTGDADTLFLNKSFVGLGWHKVGDLRPFKRISLNSWRLTMAVNS